MTASVGDRIELEYMHDDPCPIPAGATGTIERVTPFPGGDWAQYLVRWDAPHEHRKLALCSPPDRFKVIA
jgi:hypothetical protein